MTSLEISQDSFIAGFFQPLSFDEFLTNYFRQKPHHFQSPDSNYFNNVFSSGDCTSILQSHLLHRPAVRMIGEKRVLSMDSISTSIPYGKFSFENVVDLEKVKHWYQKGYTINIRAAHLFHEGLGNTVNILKSMFGCNVRANIYLTPTMKSGLIPHYDVHDVVVFQVSGSKLWKLYTNNFDRPTEAFRFRDGEFDVGNEIAEITLRPGDLLYLPRGVTHAATALEDSLHITFGIEEPTLCDVLHSLVSILEKNPAMRSSVNCGKLVTESTLRQEAISATQSAVIEALFGREFDEALGRTLEENHERSPTRDVSFLKGL
jgi:Cupin superfamily protein